MTITWKELEVAIAELTEEQKENKVWAINTKGFLFTVEDTVMSSGYPAHFGDDNLPILEITEY